MGKRCLLGAATVALLAVLSVQAGHTRTEFGTGKHQREETAPSIGAAGRTSTTDIWPTFAHDYRRTSASNIDVVDPNGVRLEWTVALPRLSSFTGPTIAGDRVYVSTDSELGCYNLATGAFLGQLEGAPEMGNSNRGYATIDGSGNVYATSGNFNAITKLGPNLEPSGIIWSVNTAYGPIPGGLGAQNRFNTCVVANVGGTDVVFVETEPASGPGHLYALSATTGALWTNWPTNPIVLDRAAKHGPAFDGTYLYVGTAIGGSNNTGSLYKIDAATGGIIWNWSDPAVTGDGWPGGVAVEGNFIYGATRNADLTGRRYKLDHTTSPPSIVWKFDQGPILYSPPTISWSFVYFPQDNPASGLLMVEKNFGSAVYNFAANGVGMMPMHATLSGDNFLFAGDRMGYWWLLNPATLTAEWSVSYPHNGNALISPTALGTHTNGNDYAAISIRQITTAGRLSVYRLHTGPRPRLVQHKFDISVPVEFGTNVSQTVTGAFENIGNVPLNFTAMNITDPLPGSSAAGVSRARRQLMERRLLYPSVDADYNATFTDPTLSKRQRLAGLSTATVDGGEFTTTDYEISSALANAGERAEYRMAAGSDLVRISNVRINGASVPTSFGVGAIGDLSFDINGTVPYLGRGIERNIINLTNDDPDFDYLPPHSVAEFEVTIVGGCLFAADTLYFGDVHGAATANYETQYNHGALGDDVYGSREFRFVADAGTPNNNLFDGSLLLLGDSGAGGVQLFVDIYGNQENYAPNPQPPGGCAMQKAVNVLLGRYRTGGGPVDIYGEWIQSAYSDTDVAATPGTPPAAIGLNILQKEVGDYDPLYGDFELIHWTFENRNAVTKGPIYPGTHIDWDINTGANLGLVSDLFNGYAMWDHAAPTIAYGMFDVNMPSTYNGIDPVPNSPFKIMVLYNNPYAFYWDYGTGVGKAGVWSDIVHRFPARLVDYPTTYADKFGVLVGKPFTVGPNATAEWSAAVYGVEASSNNAATIEANAVALAKRAARWAGFARGDVNEDTYVDLLDVAWLIAALPKYPADYCGDVNADGLNNSADIARLLSWVSGHPADRPLGAWRF